MFDVAFSRRMCCSRLQRQHVAGFPSASTVAPTMRPGIRRVGHACGEDAEVRAAERQVVAQSLPFGDGQVRPEGAGRLEHAQRQRVEDLHEARPARVRGRFERRHVLQQPVVVRMLHHDRGHVVVHRRDAAVAVRCWDDLRLVPRARAVRSEGLDVAGVDGPGDEHARAATPPGHVDGLDERRRAVVQRGVRHLHGRQVADHRLVLEQRPEHALGELRLVGGVGGRELGSPGQRPHEAGDVMVVGARSGEAHQIVRASVHGAQAPEISDDLHLRDPERKIQVALEADRIGNLLEQLADAGKPERCQHRGDVGLGVGREPHGVSVRTSRAILSPSGPPARTSSPARGSRAGRRSCTGPPGSAPAAGAPCGSSS